MNNIYLDSIFRIVKFSPWQRISRHPFLCFAVIHTIILFGLFTFLNYYLYSDPGTLERWFALNILSGHELPYRDFIAEYPPLAIVSFIIPAFIFREPFSYNLALAMEMLIADLIILYILIKFASRLKSSVWVMLGGYSLFILCIGQIITMRHDMIPALLVILTIYAYIMGKNKTSWALLGMGIMMKLYPVVLVPLFAIFYWFNKSRFDLIQGIMILAGVILVIAIPWLIIDSSSFLTFFLYHTQRGLQGESSYATVLLVMQIIGLVSVRGITNFGSWNLNSQLADNLAALSPYVMIGCLLAIYIGYGLIIWRRRMSTSLFPEIDTGQVRLVSHFALLTILALILTDKVLSPQYIIWIAPLLAIYTAKGRYLLWLIFIVIGIFTQYVFPYHYGDYQSFVTIPIIIELLRNIGLLAMAVIIIRYIPYSSNKEEFKASS